MNMFMLWMFGMVIENVWGPKKFLFYYIICGVGAGLCQELAQYASYMVQHLADYQLVNTGSDIIPMGQYLNLMTTVGASGAIYAILLALRNAVPPRRADVHRPRQIPIKAKWLVIGSVALELFYALGQPGDRWLMWPISGVCSSVHSDKMLAETPLQR